MMSDRCNVCISDGLFFCEAMLSAEKNASCDFGKVMSRKPIRSVFCTSTLFGARRWDSQFFTGFNFAPRPEKCGGADKPFPRHMTRLNPLKVMKHSLIEVTKFVSLTIGVNRTIMILTKFKVHADHVVFSRRRALRPTFLLLYYSRA